MRRIDIVVSALAKGINDLEATVEEKKLEYEIAKLLREKGYKKYFVASGDMVSEKINSKNAAFERSVCFKHSKKHNVTRSEVSKLDCEVLPCSKDCPLIR